MNQATFQVYTVNCRAQVRTRKSFTDYDAAVAYARRLASARRPALFVNIMHGTYLVWQAMSGREMYC